jgi:hypothetical protein
MPDRTCNGCTMCCRVLRVEADDGTLLSGANEWCAHCTVGKGCGIYAERPKACRVYACLWREGAFRDEDRPDKSKLLVSIVDMEVWPRGQEHEPVETSVLQFKECAPGVLDTPRAKRIIAAALPYADRPVAYSPYGKAPTTVKATGPVQHRWLDPEYVAQCRAEAVEREKEAGE